MVIGVFSQEMGIEGEREEQSRAVSYLLYIPETEAEMRDSCLEAPFCILAFSSLFVYCILYACRIGVSYFDLHTLAESTGMERRHE